MDNTKKFILGGVVVVLLGGYALWSASRSEAPVVTPTPVADTPTGGQPGSASVPSETTNTNTSNGVDNGIGEGPATYKDGTYMGSLGDAAPYGQVQVSAVISGGKLTKVNILKAPEGPGHTNELTATVFPKLAQEAISIQSAKVNMISGATQDVQGFRESLAIALAIAAGQD